ncbi:hypothetical protein [Roseobacter sp.]|uniref:hypothetical protein n=1 Tax=Roseobacter sp. TaxID=1907202 RepID=UPI0038597CE4
MKHAGINDQKTSLNVLELEDSEISRFIEQRIKKRSLSKLVTKLNNDILYGTSTERENAEKALDRLGLLCC